MGGGSSKAEKAAAKASGAEHHAGISSAHSIVPAWGAGNDPLAGHAISSAGPRKARRALEVNTLKAPAPGRSREDSLKIEADPDGWKSDVVVMASPFGEGADPSQKLGQLKGLLQNGLIEQADFEERKRQLLDGFVSDDGVELSEVRSPREAAVEEPSALIRTGRARLLVKPLDEDLDPWDRQRWWESDVGREERLLRLSAGNDVLSWHAISSGEKLGEIGLRDCILRRTTTRPRGQGSPGFLMMSRAAEGEVPEAGKGHRTECHVRIIVEPDETGDGGGGQSEESAQPEWVEFEAWMDALAPFLPRPSVGVSLRFLQRMLSENPRVADDDLSSAELYREILSEGLLPTESHVQRVLRDSQAAAKQPHEIGPTTAFVSHAHEASFPELVATLAQIELRAVQAEGQNFRAYYWIDIFCQSAASPASAEKLRRKEAKERSALRRAFESADIGGSGALSMGGFASALKKVGVVYSNDVLRQLMASLDVNGNGTIELPEFEAVVTEFRKSNPDVMPLTSKTGKPILMMEPPGEELASRRRPMEVAWHPAGVPKLLLLLCEWPSPTALRRLGCWYELMMAIEVGADLQFELSPGARAGFINQVKTGDLSFTIDQRPRWNRPRPGEYSSGPVAQAIDLRTVAALAKGKAVDRERRNEQHWLGGHKAEEVDWILHQVEQLPTLTTRGQGGRWVTRGIDRLNTAVRNAVEEELHALYQDSVFTGDHDVGKWRGKDA